MESPAVQPFHDPVDWVPELASILPLSALVDFLDATRVFHNLQLTGRTARWCWPITPASSRMLFSLSAADETCLLDRFDASTTPTCLDGRYGDRYPMANPETLRLCLATVEPQIVDNTHDNMSRGDIRVHEITLVRVLRQPEGRATRDWPGLLAKAIGWLLLGAMVAFSILSSSWLLLTFLVLVTSSGWVVSQAFLCGPRMLRADGGSVYNRLVLSAQHMNATHWTVFYGESSLVNSLLNWPLRPQQTADTRGKAAGEPARATWLKRLLRVLVLGQWATTIGAASLKGWDAYGISLWIVFCIGMNFLCFATERSAGLWLRNTAVKMDTFVVKVSSRRALLNTVLALNPDTFPWDSRTGRAMVDKFSPNATTWIDDILKAGDSRSRWEDASRISMGSAMQTKGLSCWAASGDIGEASDWDETAGGKEKQAAYMKEYWFKFIEEGIEVADKLTTQAGLSGRLAEVLKQ